MCITSTEETPVVYRFPNSDENRGGTYKQDGSDLSDTAPILWFQKMRLRRSTRSRQQQIDESFNIFARRKASENPKYVVVVTAFVSSKIFFWAC